MDEPTLDDAVLLNMLRCFSSLNHRRLLPYTHRLRHRVSGSRRLLPRSSECNFQRLHRPFKRRDRPMIVVNRFSLQEIRILLMGQFEMQ